MTNPNTHPAPAMVYGGAPMMSDDGPAPFAAITQQPGPADAPAPSASSCRVDASYMTGPRTGCHLIPRPDLEPLQAEIATLRADNDARGQVIDELRAERDIARANVGGGDRRNEALAAELDAVRSERDAVREELTDVLIELDRARMELAQARRDRDKYFAAYQRTLRALNATLGEP